MSLQDTNSRIQTLFNEWRGLQPLKAEYREKLDNKIRLEWNFHSNHIEGNPLTIGETTSLLEHKLREGGHSVRDYDEVEGHNAAINEIMILAGDEGQILTEAKLRNLNKMVLGNKPFMKDAQTPDGKPTRRKITPGQYKTEPNSVETATGEMHYFSDPSVVPAEMGDFMKWLRENLDSPPESIASFVAELHYKFISIHPFDDGNGRVVRLLVNYVLLRLDYPPLVIKSENKKSYIAALRKADDGDMDTFAVYLGDVLVFWLQKGVSAAKGEDIEDVGDLDKRIEVFKRGKKLEDIKSLSKEMMKELHNILFVPLLETLEDRFETFNELFSSREMSFKIGTAEGEGNWRKELHKYVENWNKDLSGNTVQIRISYSKYRGEEPFDMGVELEVVTYDSQYEVNIRAKVRSWSNRSFNKRRIYSHMLTKSEIKELIEKGREDFFNQLEQEVGRTYK